MQLRDEDVLVLGLGQSGLAMARWCASQGARVTVADTRQTPPRRAALQTELPDAYFVSGPFTSALLDQAPFAAVFRSPGLLPVDIAPVLDAATARGLWTGGELDLFAHALAGLRETQAYAPVVLAITGTNGKTTVTTLAGQLVAAAGKSVAVAGNIGPSLLDTLAVKQAAGALPAVWVLELSSFQLDQVQGFEPTAAAVLNISQDHLDWHGDMQAYAHAKARIFGLQARMLLNREDPLVMQMLSSATLVSHQENLALKGPGVVRHEAPEAQRIARIKTQKPASRPYTTFGGDMPQRPGDFGIETVNGMAWLVRALEADETHKRRKDTQELYIQRLMPADALRIRGRHNAVNALAALALASAFQLSLAPMLYALRDYRGEPHRVQPVAVVAGVEYFDDSKGTNVGATVAALRGLGAERHVTVILGGEGKGQDFSPLSVPVARYARAVVLIGRDASLIRAALQDTGVALLDAADLPQAVRMAAERSHVGDAVLLSPACASFDMFDNYEHRARVFCDAVQTLADDLGALVEGSA